MYADVVQHIGGRNGRRRSKQVLFERINVVCARCFPRRKQTSLLSRVPDWGGVMFNKWTCAVFARWCTTLPVVQNDCAPSKYLQPHIGSFLGSTHRLLPLGCSWHRVIIWTACRSLGSTRYHPHSFSLSFQLPLTLSSWPCSCFFFFGRGYFLCFFHSLFDQSVLIYYLVEEGMWCLSPTPWTFTLSKTSLPLAGKGVYVNMCTCVYVVY